MDNDRFDHLARLIGTGASRRTILKRILGIGGVAAVSSVDETSARALRPRITTPPPPACPLPNQMCGGECCGPGRCKDGHCCPAATDVWCGDAGCCDADRCAGGDTCCDPADHVCGATCCSATASCARSGNTDICCDPTQGDAPCGLDCCDHPLRCCDLECCGNESACLSLIFPGQPEEICCPLEQLCDGDCCDGECFDPAGFEIVINGLPLDTALLARECCPVGSEVCVGVSNSVCCDLATEECCTNNAGEVLCIPIDGCCEDEHCLPLPPGSDGCTGAICGPDNRCDYSSCPDGLSCCVNAPEPVCLDLAAEGVCCTTPHCNNGCEECVATICQPACEVDDCCMSANDPAEWHCRVTDDCCEETDCDEGELCCAGVCVDGPCCADADCDGLQSCCVLDQLSFCLDLTIEGACCHAGDCPPPAGECQVAACTDFQCVETGDPTCCPQGCAIGQRCCPGGYCIPFDLTCCNAQTEEEDCPAGYACCGGFCDLGECCIGIADDGRCGTGNTCCVAETGNYCVTGESCPTTTTTTGTLPPVTTTTTGTTSPPITTTTATTPAPSGCTSDGQCTGTCEYCATDLGRCVVDRCCTGESECSDPCAICSRNQCQTETCADRCQECTGLDNDGVPICVTRDVACCRNPCPSHCTCNLVLETCDCTAVPPGL